jgi:hypothetical protein
VSIEQQLFPAVAVSAGYYRTWFGNFTVVDNLEVAPSDFDHFCVPAPNDPRLPADVSGSNICGLYDIKPEKFGLENNLRTLADNYGSHTEVYNGVDINFAVRHQRLEVQGGWNIGNSVQTGLVAAGEAQSGIKSCYVVDSPEQLRFCDNQPPYQQRFKVSASYLLPWDVQMASVFQTTPGVNYTGAWTITSALARPSLGRDLSGGNRTVQILAPGEHFIDERINQLDLRFSKIFRIGGKRLQGNFDLYNVLNASTVLAVNNTFGQNFLVPQQVIDARLLKFSAQFDF